MILKIPTEPNSEFNISVNNNRKLEIELFTSDNPESGNYYFQELNDNQVDKLYKIVKTLKGE
jgi:hypothetical protein